jgi:hypothetical protein
MEIAILIWLNQLYYSMKKEIVQINALFDQVYHLSFNHNDPDFIPDLAIEDHQTFVPQSIPAISSLRMMRGMP